MPSAMPGMSSDSSAKAGGGSAALTIVIKGYKYTTPASVAPGAMVTVRNDDDTAHTVTADSGGAFDVNIDAHKSATFKAPADAGSYKFKCTYHPYMHGTLTVK